MPLDSLLYIDPMKSQTQSQTATGSQNATYVIRQKSSGKFQTYSPFDSQEGDLPEFTSDLSKAAWLDVELPDATWLEDRGLELVDLDLAEEAR